MEAVEVISSILNKSVLAVSAVGASHAMINEDVLVVTKCKLGLSPPCYIKSHSQLLGAAG